MGRLIASLLAAVLLSFPVAAGSRVASLGLCTDELLLLLAPPEQVASVSFLVADPEESELARRAAGVPRNDGSLESALKTKPDLILTGGAVNARASELAKRVGLEVLDLPPPSTLDALRTNIRRLGAALGRKAAADRLVASMNARLGRERHERRAALKVETGGLAAFTEGLSAEMFRHAGLDLIATPEVRVDRERLLIDPPPFLIRSRYREGVTSRPATWRPPEGPWRTLWLDGRRWTCPSPLAALDVARLRREVANTPIGGD